MLISPTEPEAIRALGSTSSMPEKFGCDIFIPSPAFGRVGVQRKEVRDLVASARGDRLWTGLAKMQALDVAVLLVEGEWNWTSSGESLKVRSFSTTQLRGLLWSVSSRGLWTHATSSMDETISYLSHFNLWCQKADHLSLRRRTKPQGDWGKATSRDWRLHVWQSFEGIGPKQAAALDDYFDGLPLRWTVTVEELQLVPGIGPKRAEALVASLPDALEVVELGE